MPEWLASLNKHTEGESDLSHLILCGEGEQQGKQGKIKSGILDKTTTNIQQKLVWPQQNLGEDWVDEDIDFRQLKFKHLVGETRTIETCTEPAQILTRPRLLCRMAYLKLRGYEWALIRKMYAAILTSIETKEYSWESNFDRFETILYKRTMGENRPNAPERAQADKESGNRKRYCKDYNRPEGCPKSSPHPVWFNSGSSAVKKMVHHLCAACLVRDRQQKEHPEGYPECPHRA